MKYKAILFLLAICIIITGSCKHQAEASSEEESSETYNEKTTLTEVEGTVLHLGEFSKELSANGKVAASQKVVLRSTISQPILEVKVENGQWVNKGQLIALLDTFELHHTLLRQKASFQKAQLDFADLLLSQGYAIDRLDEVPDNQLTNAKMRSGLTIAQTDLTIALDKYNSAFIKAPIDGHVANLSATEGNYPGNNGHICTIINNKVLKVDFYILEEESKLIKNGLNLEVAPFYDESERYKGTVTAINPTVDNGLILLSGTIARPDSKLYDGITVKVYARSQPQTCLAVPKEAVVLRTGRKVVFTYNPVQQHAIWNYVTTADENSTHIVVTEGLSDGDTVITAGNLHLGHEVPVSMSQLTMCN